MPGPTARQVVNAAGDPVALPNTDRIFAAFSRNVARVDVLPTVARILPGAPAHQGRGNAALGLADRIIAEANAAAPVVAREDVTPEMEPDSPSLTTEETGEDFVDNEDVTDDLEPNDPSIESSLRAQRVVVTGDEDSVTITAEDGETIVAVTEEDSGDLEVVVEDTADVLLAAPAPLRRVTITGDETEITITADEGEVLDVEEGTGIVIVDVLEDVP